MKTKTISLLFILTLFLVSCSTDQVINEEDVAKEVISNNLETRAGCWFPDEAIWFDIVYEQDVTPAVKIAIRNQYSSFLGITCVLLIDNLNETWICDKDIYDSYCHPCIIASKCCKNEVVEEDDGIEKMIKRD